MTEGNRTVRLFITGRVQGIGFRYWCVREAQRLGIDGWVRNRKDGSVEAVAHGTAEAVGALIEACRRGPSAAAVEEVHVSDADMMEAGPHGFREQPTA